MSRSRSQVKTTGVTTKTCSSELTMPPSTGAASGFMNSAPVLVDHINGSSLTRKTPPVRANGDRSDLLQRHGISGKTSISDPGGAADHLHSADNPL